VDKRLLDLLVCPVCKGPLRHAAQGGTEELICIADRLAYAVQEGIPVMMPEDARVLEIGDPLLAR
jgi:uncharacterized protein YbaR (Trm112 family)